MSQRRLLLLAGVLILLIPLASGSLGFYYAFRASEWPEQDERQDIKEIQDSRNQEEARWHYEVTDPWKYMVIKVGLGGCCPEFEEGDALTAAIETPHGGTHELHVEVGECHSGGRDFCNLGRDYPEGWDAIVIVNPPQGNYYVTIKPSGSLEALPQGTHLGGGFAMGYTELVNDPTLRADKVWWFYPDGSERFVEDGGYFGWAEAIPRLWGLGALTVAGLAGSVVVMNRAKIS